MKAPLILRIFQQGNLVEIKQFQTNQIIIGNEGEVEIRLVHSEVSPVHALIEERGSGYFISDLGSATGTFKNGQPILDTSISSGDQIGIGPFELHFFIGIPKPKLAPSVGAHVQTAKPPASKAGSTSDRPSHSAANERPTVNVPTSARQKSSPQIIDGGLISPPLIPTSPSVVSEKNQSLPVPKFAVSTPPVEPGRKRHRGDRTFAPPSQVTDLSSYVKSTTGPVLEVLVCWHERIISSQHFDKAIQLTMGSSEKAHVLVPGNFCKALSPLADVGSRVRVYITSGVDFNLRNAQGVVTEISPTKLVVGATAKLLTLEQGDVVTLQFEGGAMQVILRFVQKTPMVPVIGFLDMSAGELGAVVISALISGLLALYFSVMRPPELLAGDDAKKKEDVPRMAQFIYEKKPIQLPPVEVQPEPKKENPVAKTEPIKMEPKLADKDKKPEKKGNSEQKADLAKTKAAEAAKGRTDRPKKFTGTQPQGGAVKMGQEAGANAQSPAVDVNTSGLMSAFGSGGIRSKLDKAYSGSGDLLGQATGAKGKTGFNENRAGDDIGGKFKEVGAGGKGTATAGIAGVNTKGRASGQSEYGKTGGLGGKGQVDIEPGDAGAEFTGTIDREAVRRVIKFHISEVKSCYERALNKRSSIEGKITVQFEIVAQGRVRTAKTLNSTIGDKTVEDCIVNRLRSWEFPEPPAGAVATVNYPFVLNAQR